MSDPTLSTLPDLLSFLIHKIDGEPCNQYHYPEQPPTSVGGRTNAAGYFRYHLALHQHLGYMHMEHSALQRTHQTSQRRTSLFHPSALDVHRSPRTGGPALPRNI